MRGFVQGRGFPPFLRRFFKLALGPQRNGGRGPAPKLSTLQICVFLRLNHPRLHQGESRVRGNSRHCPLDLGSWLVLKGGLGEKRRPQRLPSRSAALCSPEAAASRQTSPCSCVHEIASFCVFCAIDTRFTRFSSLWLVLLPRLSSRSFPFSVPFLALPPTRVQHDGRHGQTQGPRGRVGLLERCGGHNGCALHVFRGGQTRSHVVLRRGKGDCRVVQTRGSDAPGAAHLFFPWI